MMTDLSCRGSAVAVWRPVVWAGLLLALLLAPSLCRPEQAWPAKSDDLLSPKPLHGESLDDLALHRTRIERDDRDAASSSGSGSGDLTPIITPDPTTNPPLPTPTAFIEISLKISVEDYSPKIEDALREILQTLLSAQTATESTATRRATSGEEDEIVLQLDRDKSSADVSIVRVYVVDSESGEERVEATKQLFNGLVSEQEAFSEEFQKATGIEVLGVEYEDGNDSPPVSMTSLMWWDILMIGIGCVAASSCPVLLALAFCCRWFSRRQEEEEKEGLLTRDAQLDVDATTGGQPPRVPPATSLGLRDREGKDVDLERRERVRRVARVGFQSRVQVQSHPLTPEEIENLLKNPATLHNEYSSIPSNLVTMADVPAGAEDKNRYKDILPNPQTRVSLFLKFAVSNSDYINGNYIRGYRDDGRSYIATQGPLSWTVDDFWRMVWEQKSSVIVMVTGLQERRIVKCSRYWPDSEVSPTASYGDLDVTLKSRITSNPHYTVSHFHVTHREKLVSREVTHFWFTAWPDHGVPTSTQPALDFLMQIRSFKKEIPAPTVVHCSAGIGRTGVFIGADVAMTQLEREGEVDLLKIVSTMRQDRGGMVQTEKQYVFLHQLMLSYAHQLKGSTISRPTSGGINRTTSSASTGSSAGQNLVLQNNYTDVI